MMNREPSKMEVFAVAVLAGYAAHGRVDVRGSLRYARLVDLRPATQEDVDNLKDEAPDLKVGDVRPFYTRELLDTRARVQERLAADLPPYGEVQ